MVSRVCFVFIFQRLSSGLSEERDKEDGEEDEEAGAVEGGDADGIGNICGGDL